MASRWATRFDSFRYQLLYPNVRRKDAGYIANILSEYAAFPLDARRRLGNFDDVERCASSLLRGLDGLAAGDALRVAQLHAALDPQRARAADAAADQADPISNRAWLQGYMRQVFNIENAVLQLQDFGALIARTPFLVERYRIVADDTVLPLKRQYDQELAPEKLAKFWDSSRAATPGAAGAGGALDDERWLRAKLTALLNDVHWWYAQSQVREELFLGQQFTVITAFGVAALLLLCAYAFGSWNCSGQVTVAVMAFGLFGAFTNVMRRMRSDAAQHGGGNEGTYKELTALAYGRVGITLSLLFGMIFAFVLMLLFEGGLATAVFNEKLADLVLPRLPIACPAGAANTLLDLMASAGDGVGNAARLFVWAFVAGFAEQLVPDALDRLTKAVADRKP